MSQRPSGVLLGLPTPPIVPISWYSYCLCRVDVSLLINMCSFIKEALYRIWCGANRLGDGGVHTLGDNSAFVNPAGQLLLPGGVRPE